MKRILGIAVVGLFLAVGSAQANCGKCGVGDEMKADKGKTTAEKADKMAKKLNLSDEQKAKYEALVTEKMAKKEAIMADKKKAMEALHEDFKAKLGAVLTPEQMKSWEAMKDDRGPMMGKCPMCEKSGGMCEHCKMNKDKKAEGDEQHEGHDK